MLVVVDIVLLVVIGLLVFYLALLSILALSVRVGRMPAVSAKRKFAVVIPAHNEQLSIAKTLKSLLAMQYPKKFFDVVVIADNCTDDTAAIARRLGAHVYERTDNTERGKGYALRWGFGRLLAPTNEYSALVVVDADSVVSRNFLEVMNYYVDCGAKAIQSSDQVESQPGVWSAETTRLGFALYNYVRPLGRKAFRLSAGLRGNGMCFAVETLHRYPWNAFSLNEDLEYGLFLLSNGVSVTFAPEAQVLATMPSDASNAETQRARWEKGRMPVIRKYAFRLLWSALRNLSFKPVDALIDLLTPPFVNLMGVASMLVGVNFLLWIFGIAPVGLICVGWSIVLVLGGVHVFGGLMAVDMDKGLLKALVYVPRYAYWKLTLYSKLLWRGKTTEWIRTSREHSPGHSLAEKSSSHTIVAPGVEHHSMKE
jgi:1,2-diacylglycerol 3-beta-glucosyltransferase